MNVIIGYLTLFSVECSNLNRIIQTHTQYIAVTPLVNQLTKVKSTWRKGQ